MNITIHEGSQVAGTAHVVLLAEDTAKIETFTVMPKYRGKNVGRSLMEKIEGYLNEKNIKKAFLTPQNLLRGFMRSSDTNKKDQNLWSKMCRR